MLHIKSCSVMQVNSWQKLGSIVLDTFITQVVIFSVTPSLDWQQLQLMIKLKTDRLGIPL